MGSRKKYSSKEKFQIVLEGLKGEENIVTLCRQHGITSGLFYKWRKEFLENGANLFNESSSSRTEKDHRRKIKELEQLIGHQTIIIEAQKKYQD